MDTEKRLAIEIEKLDDDFKRTEEFQKLHPHLMSEYNQLLININAKQSKLIIKLTEMELIRTIGGLHYSHYQSN